MGHAARSNPTAQAAARGELKLKAKEETFRQKLARARVERFQKLMEPKKDDAVVPAEETKTVEG